MLQDIASPAELRRLSIAQTEALAGEIRQRLIDTVKNTGGHLASNLGTVELTLALHRVLNTPEDKIVFDVGHQCYTHKLITGREARFDTIRQEGGLSGFPKRPESPYDVFETGHASTALSAALGLARARDARGEVYAVAALVGDGALTGGMCYEALNDAGSRPTQLIMVLNDNEMSIAPNVGALSTYLTRLRGSERWLDAKKAVKRGLHRVPLVGARLAGAMEKVKRTIKLMLIPGEFFEALGFGYLGPIDGHDIRTLENTLRDARAMDRPVVVHAVTQKGRGYAMAERRPEVFHGVAPFFVESGKIRMDKRDDTVSPGSVAGDTLAKMAEEDERIVAITAAMEQGTGLSKFKDRFPDRFFDVGIAEEHAMTLAAGMAAGGLRPVFAVYASFLQRAVDQLLHDVCLQNLPVTVLVDRAGFVPGDGATHQGVYDLSMLRAMPNLTVYAPADARELRAMLEAAMKAEGPCVIRYPKRLPRAVGGEAAEIPAESPYGADPSDLRRCEEGLGWRPIVMGESGALIGYGHSVTTALETAERLRGKGMRPSVISASTLLPLDREALESLRGAGWIAVLEESQANGGLGEAVAAYFAGQGPRVFRLGIPGVAPGGHSVPGLLAECGIDAAQAAKRIEEALRG